MVTAMDDAVGSIVDKLQETGLYEDTIIAFVSDVSSTVLQLLQGVQGVQGAHRTLSGTIYVVSCRSTKAYRVQGAHRTLSGVIYVVCCSSSSSKKKCQKNYTR